MEWYLVCFWWFPLLSPLSSVQTNMFKIHWSSPDIYPKHQHSYILCQECKFNYCFCIKKILSWFFIIKRATSNKNPSGWPDTKQSGNINVSMAFIKAYKLRPYTMKQKQSNDIVNGAFRLTLFMLLKTLVFYKKHPCLPKPKKTSASYPQK